MKINLFYRILVIGCLLIQFSGSVSIGHAAPLQQVSSEDPRVQALLDQLTPEEKVGQLFLITFKGTDVSSDSQIYELIANKHIGGVILKAENDNFVAAPDTIRAAWELNRGLQTIEYLSSLDELPQNEIAEAISPNYIPLFIGVSQDGGGYPNDEILHGLTELPSTMAIGATWQPELAFEVGEVLGRELSGLGFNLLIGPTLDVLNTPNPESSGDLGSLSFGGNPYWVAAMAQAYISGVNQGSSGRIATVAKHLPGRGGLDLPADVEIPTMRKTIEQLSQTELLPFFSVTGGAPSEEAAVDALLLSHIRYEGFQGSIRATTRPVSLDPQAFNELMSLQDIASWRDSGGVVISDDLGTRAIRTFFDPSGQNFTRTLARDVAREAFLAGNDILSLGNFITEGDVDNYRTIIDILEFFTQKYEEDAAFAQRVDESLRRVLSLKIKIYDDFIVQSIVPTEAGLNKILEDSQISFDVSRQAATLLSPSAADLDNAIPSVPDVRTRIIFFTDTYDIKQCSTCPEQDLISVDALARAVNRLYGPLASGQVFPERLLSYRMEELAQLLDDDAVDNPLSPLVDGAQWLVFLMQDVDSERPASMLLKRFLAERQDIIQDKNIIVFALDAPYYLNATEISKTTAYYALYSRGTEFLDVAARLLFKEIPTLGASPVSIVGVGYDLELVTAPNTSQLIRLFASVNDSTSPLIPLPPEEGTTFALEVGDVITLVTSTIVDNNGNQVPNGTSVRFLISTTVDGNTSQRESTAITQDGIAQTLMRIDSAGSLNVQVFSGDPAAESELIQLEISGTDSVAVSAEPSNDATTEPTSALEPTAESTPENEGAARTQTTLGDWALSVLTSLLVALFAYQSGVTSGKVTWGLRWGLMSIIGGLLINVYLGFGLPGTAWIIMATDIWGVVATVMVGAFLGWGIGWLWWLRSNPQ
ncbi:MAG: hypothetical protein N2C13_02915 [Chloroflexota bacterium]